MKRQLTVQKRGGTSGALGTLLILIQGGGLTKRKGGGEGGVGTRPADLSRKRYRGGGKPFAHELFGKKVIRKLGENVKGPSELAGNGEEAISRKGEGVRKRRLGVEMGTGWDRVVGGGSLPTYS